MDTTEKKTYETPEIEVIELECQPSLMAKSPDPDSYDGWGN